MKIYKTIINKHYNKFCYISIEMTQNPNPAVKVILSFIPSINNILYI